MHLGILGSLSVFGCLVPVHVTTTLGANCFALHFHACWGRKCPLAPLLSFSHSHASHRAFSPAWSSFRCAASEARLGPFYLQWTTPILCKLCMNLSNGWNRLLPTSGFSKCQFIRCVLYNDKSIMLVTSSLLARFCSNLMMGY